MIQNIIMTYLHAIDEIFSTGFMEKAAFTKQQQSELVRRILVTFKIAESSLLAQGWEILPQEKILWLYQLLTVTKSISCL